MDQQHITKPVGPDQDIKTTDVVKPSSTSSEGGNQEATRIKVVTDDAEPAILPDLEAVSPTANLSVADDSAEQASPTDMAVSDSADVIASASDEAATSTSGPEGTQDESAVAGIDLSGLNIDDLGLGSEEEPATETQPPTENSTQPAITSETQSADALPEVTASPEAAIPEPATPATAPVVETTPEIVPDFMGADALQTTTQSGAQGGLTPSISPEPPASQEVAPSAPEAPVAPLPSFEEVTGASSNSDKQETAIPLVPVAPVVSPRNYKATAILLGVIDIVMSAALVGLYFYKI